MSVQAGIWNFDGKPVDQKLLADFGKSMKHQGPDGESCFVDRSIGMLYRPFHTTAESRQEKQPYRSRKGFILTWDGRLDNRAELTAELRSCLDVEPTDVAIVAAAFDNWETDSFRRIVGDWAVSIWKPRDRELVFAVDYMALRHIFYYLSANRVWWSTDLSPLVLLSGEKFHIDEQYIAGYFAHEPEAHLTPYREIREAPPGQFVRIENGKTAVERYWRFRPRSRIRYKGDAEYEEHFRHLFRQSVRRRIRSDSPVLAELSGGLDSSSIVCMADDILEKESFQRSHIDTLSFYDKTEPGGDDWMYFPKVEEKRGRSGHHIDASKLGTTSGPLEYSEFAPVPGYLGVGRQVEAERAGVMRDGGYRVVLSGVGGDEFLGGIPDPSALLGDLIMQWKFVSLAKQLMAWSLVKRRPWIQLLKEASVNLLPVSLGQHFTERAKVDPWIDTDFARRTRLGTKLLDVDEHFGLRLPTRRAYIAGVVLMANKLAKWKSPEMALEESRYPYLDQDLIEFILSIPATQLLRPGERRSLMRRSLSGVVPKEILTRRTKQFSARTPLVALGKNWGELHIALDQPLSSNLGYVNAACFQEQLCAARNGKQTPIVRLLRTIALELWLRDLTSRRLIDPEASQRSAIIRKPAP